MLCFLNLLLGLLILNNALVASGKPARGTTPARYYRPNISELIPDEYAVVLHKNSTYEDHFNFIGVNLSESASLFKKIASINGYRAKLDLDLVQRIIRCDPNVRYVEHDLRIEVSLGWPVEGPKD